jgi:predicted ATPase
MLDSSRLLTLVGMGGSGKTRLALRLAETRLDTFPDGVWFVDVAPLAEPERVVEVLAATLGVRDEPGRTLLQGITDTLATRRALVLIDNSESHLAACARLAAHLLRACRELRLLTTSREPLDVDGESVFTVPTLEIPAPGAPAQTVATSESVLLFAERARTASPDFELTDANQEEVAEICRRLDGIPLALELAAARVRLLGVEQIHARLGDRFKLLTRGAGVPSRQQTVRAMIQWSWDHLLAPEQDLMRRLAVFTGGWTLERAARICSDTGDEFEVLDLLARLAERSLVVVARAADGTARYRFLESVWRFALEKLEAHAERDTIRERHFAVYLALAERADVEMRGPGLVAQLAELGLEEENLLAALAWRPHAADGARRGLRLAGCVSRLWSIVGRYATGRRALEEALAHDTAAAPTPERSMVLTRAAGFAVHMGDYDAAHAYLEQSLALCRAIGNRKGVASAISGLGVVAMMRSRFEEAFTFTEEGMTIYRELGELRGVAMALHNLGTIEYALERNDHGRPRFESALSILRERGDIGTEALCLSALAAALVRMGEMDASRERLLECLAVLARLDAPREGTFALEAMVLWLVTTGRASEAARIAGAAEAARLALGAPHAPHERQEFEKLLARLEEGTRAAEAEGARAAGRTLTLNQALAEMLSLLGGPAQ